MRNPHTQNTKGNQRILEISESLCELTEMAAEALQGKLLQFDRAESVSSWQNYLCLRRRSLARLHFTSELNSYLYGT